VRPIEPDWLQETGELEALCPVVVFENEDGLAEFEPHIPLLDRINQQILQRMTIATIQAFKQRAMKGLPKTDPKTGELINYDDVFTADPGAIWNIPASVEIWESGQVDLGPILLAIRDDVKDLAATSGTPLYSITPDAANGSAEGASLQRETLTFKVERGWTAGSFTTSRGRADLPHRSATPSAPASPAPSRSCGPRPTGRRCPSAPTPSPRPRASSPATTSSPRSGAWTRRWPTAPCRQLARTWPRTPPWPPPDRARPGQASARPAGPPAGQRPAAPV
jgi:hypothetical protein